MHEESKYVPVTVQDLRWNMSPEGRKWDVIDVNGVRDVK